MNQLKFTNSIIMKILSQKKKKKYEKCCACSNDPLLYFTRPCAELCYFRRPQVVIINHPLVIVCSTSLTIHTEFTKKKKKKTIHTDSPTTNMMEFFPTQFTSLCVIHHAILLKLIFIFLYLLFKGLHMYGLDFFCSKIPLQS